MESQKRCISFANLSRGDRSHCILFGRNWPAHLVEIRSMYVSCLLDARPARADNIIAFMHVKRLPGIQAAGSFSEIVSRIATYIFPAT